jgi:hypothetical protein
MAQIQNPVQTVKVLDGQVFICSPIAANYIGKLSEPRPIKFPVLRLIRAVEGRMEHCMEQLLKAQREGQITLVERHEDITIVHFSWGEAFHSGSYSAMESLLAKLKANMPLKEGLDVVQLEELLTVQEADQLFKSWIMAGYPWDSMATLLDCLRDDLRNKAKA